MKVNFPSRFHPPKSLILAGTQGPREIEDFSGYELPHAGGGRIIRTFAVNYARHQHLPVELFGAEPG